MVSRHFVQTVSNPVRFHGSTVGAGIGSYLDARAALNLTVHRTFEAIGKHLWPELDDVSSLE